jgi:hypothetical protein
MARKKNKNLQLKDDPVRAMRLSDEAWNELIEKKRASGKTWNKFLKYVLTKI